jgi:hypothetical protein
MPSLSKKQACIYHNDDYMYLLRGRENLPEFNVDALHLICLGSFGEVDLSLYLP